MAVCPAKIVCFDVSNIQGDESVASKVSFFRELPDKIHYRRYKIRDVTGINDYAMIREALGRMLRGIREGRESFIPDLIMIDGGRGHLNTALKVLREEGMERIEMIAIAERFEHVFSPKFREPIIFPAGTPVLHLLEKVRDEAHRFAITYHRSLKSKKLESSLLDQIDGVGARRKRILLKSFDTLEDLKRANLERLRGIQGIDSVTAQKIFDFFHPR